MKGIYKGKYRKKAAGSVMGRIVLVLAGVLLVLSASGLGFYAWQANRARAEFDRLSAMTQTQPPEPTPDSEPTEEMTTQVPQETEGEGEQQETQESIPEETAPPRQILSQYRELYGENPDLWGWVTVPGTVIDYPVMHTPSEPDKYLHLDFSQNYNYGGTPYLDAGCDENSDNLLVYAHNMKNGTMFQSLPQYDSQKFWENHPTFVLNTLYEEREFEVMAAFYDRVYYKTEDCFKFYQLKNVNSQEEFDNAVQILKEKSIYDTGVTAEYGDQLAMLVTCAYHIKNGRFVLVGRYHGS